MPRVYPPIEGRQTGSTVSPSLVESIAGFTAGIVSTLVVHPFDVVKTRLQSKCISRSVYMELKLICHQSTTRAGLKLVIR